METELQLLHLITVKLSERFDPNAHLKAQLAGDTGAVPRLVEVVYAVFGMER